MKLLPLSAIFCGLLCFGSNLFADDWCHLTVQRNGMTLSVDYQYTYENRTYMAPKAWINVQGDRLTSTSIVDVNLDGDYSSKTAELLYNPRNNSHTWFVDNLFIMSEGKTGGRHFHNYTIRMNLDGSEFLSVGSVTFEESSTSNCLKNN